MSTQKVKNSLQYANSVLLLCDYIECQIQPQIQIQTVNVLRPTKIGLSIK